MNSNPTTMITTPMTPTLTTEQMKFRIPQAVRSFNPYNAQSFRLMDTTLEAVRIGNTVCYKDETLESAHDISPFELGSCALCGDSYTLRNETVMRADFDDVSTTTYLAHQYLENRSKPKLPLATMRRLREIQEYMLSFDRLVSNGVSVSERLIFQIFGHGRRLKDWRRETLDRFPDLKRNPGFRYWLNQDENFQLPLSFVDRLAFEDESFAGMVVMLALHDSRYFHQSLLDEPFDETLMRYHGLLFLQHGLVDSCKLHAFLGFKKAEYHNWLQIHRRSGLAEVGSNCFKTDAPADTMWAETLLFSPTLAVEMVTRTEPDVAGMADYAYRYFVAREH